MVWVNELGFRVIQVINLSRSVGRDKHDKRGLGGVVSQLSVVS